MTIPVVFDYTDFRKFARDHIRAMKSKRAQYSLSVLSRKTKSLSKSSLSLILNGKRDLPAKQIFTLGQSLQLTGKQLTYFETLVKLNQTARPEEREILLKQMVVLRPKVAKENFTLPYYKLLHNWHAMVIREFIKHPSFDQDPVKISRFFKRRISAADAVRAIDLLRQTGAITKTESGKFTLSESSVKTSDEIPSPTIRAYHRSCMQLGAKVLDTVSVENREYFSISSVLSPDDFILFKNRLKELRDEFGLFESKLTPDSKVVQMNLQFFALNE